MRPCWLIAAALLIYHAALPSNADAQYRCAVAIEIKEKAVLLGQIRDVERPATDQLWELLRTLSFSPTKEGRELPDLNAVEQATLKGKLRVAVNGAGDVELTELHLVRNKFNNSAWIIAPADVERILKSRRTGVSVQDKGKDKGPPAAQKPTLTPGPSELKKAVAVALKCGTPGAVIRYTLDGSTPSADSGALYADPINVDKTTTITAVAFGKDLAPSQPTAGTYLVGPKEGLSTFHIGNSLTNTTAKFPDFVRTAGILHKYQSFTAGGHLTWQLWDNQLPKRQKEWDTKLASYKRIDHFTVQPRDFTKNSVDHEADYAIRFFEVIRKHSPDMQPWFYAEWVEKNRGRPTDQGKMSSRQMKQLYPAQTWEESMSAMLLYNEDLQAKVVETYKEGKRPRVLPSCIAMGWIKNLIDHGKLPGADKGSMYPFLFSNDSVHPNVKGGYLVDMTWYAAFYRESPEGKVLPAGTGLTAEQAKVMQKLAWDVVKNYPDCGLYEEGTTPVASPEFVAEGKTLTLTSKTPGAWFRYTLDGTAPTRTRGYVYCGVVSLPPGATLKAIAYKSGLADSTVAEMRMAAGKGG